MKAKYLGIANLGLILFALIATVLYVFNLSVIAEKRVQTTTRLPELNVPDEAALKRMKGFEKRIPQLAQPDDRQSGPVDLRAFGYRPGTSGRVYAGRSTSGAAETVLPVYFDYRLTLAFTSGDRGFCMIDGEFYEKNALLPDGSRITRIEPRRVLVAKDRFQQWIPLAREKGTKPAREGRSAVVDPNRQDSP